MKIFDLKLMAGIQYFSLFLVIVALASGCGGGETRPDRPDEGSESNAGAVLGGIILVGAALILAKRGISNNKSDEKETTSAPNLYLVPVTNSVYDKINYIGDEPKEFGVYTYVLLGKYPAHGEHTALYKKYKLILDIVQEKPYWPEYLKPVTSNKRDQSAVSDIDTENMNVYLIPSSEEQNQRIVSVSGYNFDFSMKILQRILSNRVGSKYRDKFLSEGPFLVSMPRTIQDNGKKYMLFADLTNVSEDMFLEIFHSYEKALKSGSNSTKDPFGIVENIRIDLGQKLVEINSIFQVIRGAYADE